MTSHKLHVQLNQYLQIYTLVQTMGGKVCSLITISDSSTMTTGRKGTNGIKTLSDSGHLVFRQAMLLLQSLGKIKSSYRFASYIY